MEHKMSDQEQLNDLANRVSRSCVAVIDTVVQRGGFKGEELTTIGQLRDQAVQVINMVEAAQGADETEE
jgi:hypothetical protein